MSKDSYTVRLGAAPGNGIPVFVLPALHREFERPFGATYVQDMGSWLYPAYYPLHKKVLKDFKALTVDIELSDNVKQWVDKLAQDEVRCNTQAFPNGFEFVTKPYEHQILALAHVYYNLRAALYYAPGLGKSKIAVDLLRLLRLEGNKSPALILGPLVTVKNWGREIDKHSGGVFRWGAMLGTPKKKNEIIDEAAAGKLDVVLLTYDTGRNFYERLVEAIPYETVIADESQLIKDWRSTRTKTAIEIGRKAKRKVIMSGTPTLGDPRDLYGQFKFLGEYFMPENIWQFENKFLTHSPFNKHVVTGYKNLDVLNARIQEVTVRKTKEECLDLPERQVIDIGFDLSKKQRALYNELIMEGGADLGDFITNLGQGKPPNPMVVSHAAILLNKLLQISSGFLMNSQKDPLICSGCPSLGECTDAGVFPYTAACKVVQREPDPVVTALDDNPKADALEELLDTILVDESNKVIIWGKYRADLDAVEKRLRARAQKFVRVDGSTGSKIQDNVDTFNHDPTCRVYLSQISTGVGITLNAANYMIYYSLDWSLGNYLQSIDRNYRIGQERKVVVYRLLGNNTVDWAVARLLEKKVDIDNVLSKKISCMMCPQTLVCIANGTEIFDEACIYKKNMLRPVTKVALIK
jgi:SNF2 family DNA or RNA helicase